MTSGNSDASRTDLLRDVDLHGTRRGFLAASGALAAGTGLTGRTVGQTSSTTRQFTVHAIPVDLVYNRYDLHQPNAAIFVLDEHLEAARNASGEDLGDGFELIDENADTADVDTELLRPLVLRANEGDTIEITLRNHLNRQISLHQTALPYDVDQSDGAAVGFNEDSTVAPDGEHTYVWEASHQGTHFFLDAANQAWDSTPSGNEGQINAIASGLYGAVVVEPAGSEWRDPETGDELRSGVSADVYDADLDTWYREFVVFYTDPDEVESADGENVMTHGINHRAELTEQRVTDRSGCADCDDEEAFYSSWVHGDPGAGDSVYETYAGDPVKLVAVGANIEENHAHHLHGHRWKEIPGRSDSDTLDTQTVAAAASHETYMVAGHGPWSDRTEMSFAEAFEAGAGGVNEGPGDYIFHCHMFPHYGEGMNAFMRAHDKERDWLTPLPNNDPKLGANSDVAGFPHFMPGEKGVLPPDGPAKRKNKNVTKEEEEALGEMQEGAPYYDPCDLSDSGTQRHYDVVALPTDVVYNDAGHHDPEGSVFVLDEDAGDVDSGAMNPEPLVIRANVGDCVTITLTNETDEPKSIHPHFVDYDVLGSDSMANGYNYSQSVDPGEQEEFRWYADEEGAIYFHDHITGLKDAMHGHFAALVVEPEGSTWRDPHTGNQIDRGTQAMIENPNGEDFREFALFWQDFAKLKDGEGYVNDLREHGMNAGVMGINFRNEPYYVRGEDPDPAYLHSSAVHGDPATPTLEAYAGDPVRIRHLCPVFEEQHNFVMPGVDFERVGVDPSDQMAETITTSQARTYALQEDPDFAPTNPDDLPVQDYLYGSGPSEDLWDGQWGLFRLFGGEVNHLKPLPDRDAPAETISDDALAEMGHPAPFASPKWQDRGHKAKFLYAWDDDKDLPPDYAARNNDSVGQVPPAAPDPSGEADRTYDVSAVQTDIVLNDHGDHDPHGIAFVPDDEVDAVLAGDEHPEPLVLRANEGETVDVNLTNRLPQDLDETHNHPQMRTPRQADWQVSSRTSLQPLNVTHDAQSSAGGAIGFNYDGTVAPGETTTYRWEADEQTDGCVLWDMADVRGHRHHGAFGQFVVEPPGASWVDPDTGDPVAHATQALITGHDEEEFLEFVLSFSDGRYVINDDGSCVVPGSGEGDSTGDGCNQIGDPEDQGFVAINNRAEPFVRRFADDDRQHKVFSSDVHGDPATPVLEASAGDRIRLRVAQTADKQRGLSFHLAGHEWKRNAGVEDGAVATPTVGVQYDFTPGKAHTIEPLGGAGGVPDGSADRTGDYVFQGMKHRRRTEGGWWGILRVTD